MFGIGLFELIVIAVVVLVFVGPKKLPHFMQQAGRAFIHIRRTATDVRTTLDDAMKSAQEEVHRESKNAMNFIETEIEIKPEAEKTEKPSV